MRVMARQVRPWLMKPENVRAPIECAKAGGGQPAEPIRDSGPRAAPKVRMYGCNRYLSAASREEKPGKGWGRPCKKSGIGKADVQPAADFLGYGLRRDAGLWSEVLRNGPNHNFIDVYVGRLFDRVGDRTSDGIR